MFKLPKRRTPLQVNEIVQEMCVPGQSLSIQQWYYVLYYVLSGEGVLQYGNFEYHLRTGDAFTIFPHTNAYVTSDWTEPLEYDCVGFSGFSADVMLSLAGFSPDNPIGCFEKNEYVTNCFGNIYKYSGKSETNDLCMTAFLQMLFAALIEGKKGLAKEPEKTYVAKAATYIVDHFQEDISIKWLADQLSVSRSQLYREFYKEYGEAPSVFLKKIRIDNARKLLATTSLSIKQIAANVGYADPQYFTRQFRKTYGYTPTALRERNLFSNDTPQYI